MNSLDLRGKNLDCFVFLGMGLGWLLLSYLILGNPWITNKALGVITLILGFVSCTVAIIKRDLKNKDLVTGLFRTFLAAVIIAYLTLFCVYLIAGFIVI